MKQAYKYPLGVGSLVAVALLIAYFTVGLPIITFKRSVRLVGPSNEAFGLLMSSAPADSIIAAVKRDPVGSAKLCENHMNLLGWAADTDRPDVVKGLLDLGFSPNARPTGCPPSEFDPPLDVAVLDGREECVRLLLDRGADPRTKDLAFEGENALDIAASCGDPKIQEMLRALTQPSTARAGAK